MQNQENMFSKFFSNPVVGIIGSVASIVGIFAAVYFYTQGRQYRELVYCVHPVRAIVASTTQTSSIKIFSGEKPILGDITAVQVALWNQGSQSIKSENILEAIRVMLNPSVPILEATIRKTSRDVIEFRLEDPTAQSGSVGVSWKILERNDGAVLQLIYAGPQSTDIVVSGIVEGQSAIRPLKQRTSIKTPLEQIKGSRILLRSLIPILVALVILELYFIIRWYKQDKRIDRVGISILGGTVVLGIGSVIFLYLWLSPLEPPFGF